MAIGSEVVGECVEGIRVEVGGKVLRMVLVCPGFFDLVLSASLGLLSGCAECKSARYWRLIDGSWWSIEEIKSPCGDRGLAGLGSSKQVKSLSTV